MEELEKNLNLKFPSDLDSPETRNLLDKLCIEKKVHCSSPRSTSRLIDKLIGEFIEPNCINPTFLMDHP